MNSIYKIFLLNLIFGMLFTSQKLNAQKSTENLTRILFVFDASNSMNTQWSGNKSRMYFAKKILSETVDDLSQEKNVQLALRVYGHQSNVFASGQDCNDTKLEVPFKWVNHNQIKQVISSITPKGTTPIARSLEYAANDFPDAKSRNVIILITDGVEACDEDPCAVSRALRSKGVTVKPFVVGMGIDLNYIETLSCIGNFFDATDENSFKNILKLVVSQAVNNTTYQINLNDNQQKPTQSDVGVTINTSKTRVLEDYYIHTLNSKGLPDTLSLDPVNQYDIKIHSIPQLIKKNVELKPGIHNEINFTAPMGLMNFIIDERRNEYADLKTIIKISDKNEIIHIQKFNSKEKYLQGTYDIEVLTLPRMIIDNVEIKEGKEFLLSIPSPGVLNLNINSQGFGSILERKGTELLWVCNTNGKKGIERIVMQPGKYVVVYKSKFFKETIYTIKKDFTIKSGVTQNLTL